MILLRLIAIVFFCYAAYCALVFFVQRQVIYPRHVIPALPERQKRADVEVIWLETSYGKVEAWFMKAAGKDGEAREAAPAVIFAHGNAELIDYWPDQLARIALYLKGFFSPFNERLGLLVGIMRGQFLDCPDHRSILSIILCFQ